MYSLANSFKALADETRLDMLALLLQRSELCVCRFEEALGISQSKASRHLRYLLNAGLLQDRREAVWVHYRLSSDLSPEGKALIAALPGILGEERLSEARRRLAEGDRRRNQQARGEPAAGCGRAAASLEATTQA